MKNVELVLDKYHRRSKVFVNGEEIKNVVSVHVSVDVNELPSVIIKAIPDQIVINGEVEKDSAVKIDNLTTVDDGMVTKGIALIIEK